MPTRAFWRALRDWSGFVGAFGMILGLTVAPYLFRDAPRGERPMPAQSVERTIDVAPALMAEAR